VFYLHKNTSDSSISCFLEEVTAQISYKPLRPSIRQELENHIQDRVDEYITLGASSADAEQQALRAMGDAITIGTELNEVHQFQRAPFLSLITALLLLTGFGFSSFIRWSPEQMANGLLYYIPGAIILISTALKGYPLLICHRKKLALVICLLYLAQIAIFFFENHYFGWNLTHRTLYFATLMFIPVVTVMLYCFRNNRKTLLLTVFGSSAVWTYFIFFPYRYTSNTAFFIFLLSILATICFMIYHGIIAGAKRKLCPALLSLLFFLGIPLISSTRADFKAFISPQMAVHSTWDDAYNGILIQELLSKTPLTHGLQLSAVEMMDYGSGAWYFASRDPRQISFNPDDKTPEELDWIRNTLYEHGDWPKYLHYSPDNVTLWDILPQHYHNNYLIAVSIFLFGWLAGFALIAALGLFYLLIFSCINRIHGQLASSLAFCCGQCLLWQGVFYVLGNLGYQYASFPNLPLVSEGRLSIVFNMLLLGLIMSAYRFDHIIDDPLPLKPIAPA